MKKKNYILFACLAITVYSLNAAEEQLQPTERLQPASGLTAPSLGQNFSLHLHHSLAGSQLTVTISHAATGSHTQNVQTAAPNTQGQSAQLAQSQSMPPATQPQTPSANTHSHAIASDTDVTREVHELHHIIQQGKFGELRSFLQRYDVLRRKKIMDTIHNSQTAFSLAAQLGHSMQILELASRNVDLTLPRGAAHNLLLAAQHCNDTVFHALCNLCIRNRITLSREAFVSILDAANRSEKIMSRHLLQKNRNNLVNVVRKAGQKRRRLA